MVVSGFAMLFKSGTLPHEGRDSTVANELVASVRTRNRQPVVGGMHLFDEPWMRCKEHRNHWRRSSVDGQNWCDHNGLEGHARHGRHWCDVRFSPDVRVQMLVDVRIRDRFSWAKLRTTFGWARISASNVLHCELSDGARPSSGEVEVMDLVHAGQHGKDGRVDPDLLRNGAQKGREARLCDVRHSRIN